MEIRASIVFRLPAGYTFNKRAFIRPEISTFSRFFALQYVAFAPLVISKNGILIAQKCKTLKKRNSEKRDRKTARTGEMEG